MHSTDCFFPTVIPCRDKSLVRQVCSDIGQQLENVTLPKMRTRTNVYSDVSQPRGVLLGAFTRRGHG
eukprot:2096520-Amphidinium_carterae.1